MLDASIGTKLTQELGTNSPARANDGDVEFGDRLLRDGTLI